MKDGGLLIRAGVVLVALVLPAVAQAQDQDDEPPGRRPIGWFAADVRAALPAFDRDPLTAAQLGVVEENLPGRGYGFAIGAHVYPLRMRRATLGAGGEIVRARASHTLQPIEEGGLPGPTVQARFESVSPQLSLNFGARDGWSYISAGMGWTRRYVEREDLAASPPEAAPRLRTLNYGGGARWFTRQHLAFAIDLRFYGLPAQAATATRPALPAGRRLVFSAGVAFK
jgi:hypothetical protein